MNSNFEELLAQVYALWLRAMASAVGPGGEINMKIIEQFYDSKIAPAAQASGSMLLVQLDWIVYGQICAILKMAHVARLEELRKDRLQERFHHLLLTVGVVQLQRAAEADGSFDLAELAAYMECSGLAVVK